MNDTAAPPVELVDRYIAIWNEADAGRRRDLIERTWAEDASYLDRLMQGDGHNDIDAMIRGMQAQFPGHRFRRTGGIDTHHGRLRFSWELVAADGTPFVGGVDFGVLAEDGRLKAITGFLDHMPG
jgi:hypothetical protein